MTPATPSALPETADTLRAERDAARAEVERLREALRQAVSEDCAMVRDLYDEKARQVDELAKLTRMLVRHVPNDKQIKAKAVDYLSRKKLQGSPFRAALTPPTP